MENNTKRPQYRRHRRNCKIFPGAPSTQNRHLRAAAGGGTGALPTVNLTSVGPKLKGDPLAGPLAAASDDCEGEMPGAGASVVDAGNATVGVPGAGAAAGF
jgi:hypothetical protein